MDQSSCLKCKSTLLRCERCARRPSVTHNTLLVCKEVCVDLSRGIISAWHAAGTELCVHCAGLLSWKSRAELECKVNLHFKWWWPLGSDHKKWDHEQGPCLPLRTGWGAQLEGMLSQAITAWYLKEPAEVVWTSNWTITLGLMYQH